MPNKVKHSINIKVASEHIDEMNHVNNVVYLQWIQDVAVSHWVTLATREWQENYLWVALRHEIDYKKPAYLGDELIAETHVASMSGVKSERLTKIYNAKTSQVMVESRTYWCQLDAKTKRPKRVEQEMIDLYIVNE